MEEALLPCIHVPYLPKSLTIEEIKYQVTGIGAGLIFTALMLYEKNDRYYTKDVIDE